MPDWTIRFLFFEQKFYLSFTLMFVFSFKKSVLDRELGCVAFAQKLTQPYFSMEETFFEDIGQFIVGKSPFCP